MRKIDIKFFVNLPIEKVWTLFIDLDNYPKYFKYINKVFYKQEMKLGSTWYDFATFVAPVIVKHKTTVFVKEKTLGFEIALPFGGFVKERINFEKINGKTKLIGTIEFDFKIFKFLEASFEKRMKESIDEALRKFKEGI